MSGTCGLSFSESFAKLGPDGSWEKTFAGSSQLTLGGHTEEYSATWPKSGIVSDGSAMELVMLAHPTKEKESSSWPTPSATPRGAHTGAQSGEVSEDGKTRISASGTRWGATLETAVASQANWATPQSRDYRTGESHRWENPERSRNLNDQAARGKQKGQLNPAWVQWLMNFPPGWTETE